jgi:ABC-2 type transport system permease protein
MKKYLKLLKISFINRLDYRQELFMSLFIGVMIFTGQAVFWGAVFWDREVVNGFNYEDILVYYLFVRIVSEIVDSKLGFRLSDMIVDGQITNFLIKPFKIRLWVMFEEFGRIIPNLFFKAGVYTILYLIVFNSISINWIMLPLFLVVVMLSYLISYNIYFLVGCVAFWSDNSRSLNYTLGRIVMFLSGGLIPMSFFPGMMQDILKYLPFKYIFDLPISVITRDINWGEFGLGVAVQVVWIGILTWVVSTIFARAVKHNESVGI